MPSEMIEAPMTGKIIEVKINVGDSIKEWDTICILESMKMENPILAPATGTISEVKVSSGQKVNSGDLIAVIEF